MNKLLTTVVCLFVFVLTGVCNAQNRDPNKKIDHRKQEESIFVKYSSRRKQSIDHRENSNSQTRKNEVVKAKRGLIQAPTQVTLSKIKSDSLTLNWFDNAKVEYGVSVERGTPTPSSKGVNYHWVRIFNVEERIDSQVKGTGWRSDYDNNLKSNTQYCYRLKTYYKRNQNTQYQYSRHSYPVCVYTPLSR